MTRSRQRAGLVRVWGERYEPGRSGATPRPAVRAPIEGCSPPLEDADYEIEIRLPQAGPELDPDLVRGTAALTLRKLHQKQARLSIAVLDDHQIAELNQRYLNRPEPTDCLSFNLAEETDSTVVEGEIVVSWETATREAAARNVPVQAELMLYVVHSLLHLLGYDDHDPAEAARMHALEDEILTAAGLGPVYGVPAG